MKDTQLYSQILGIEKPWKVTDVRVSLADDEVAVTVEHVSGKLGISRGISRKDKQDTHRRV